MNIQKKEITLYWFKRDLRIHDNEALSIALSINKPILFIYFLEPSLRDNPHYSLRHMQFIKESLADLNNCLLKFNTFVLCVEEEVVPGLAKVFKIFNIANMVSTQEIGLGFTFNRDKKVAAFCKEQNVKWIEARYNGIIRGLRDRRNWAKNWLAYVSKPIVIPMLENGEFIQEDELQTLETYFTIFSTHTAQHSFQKGGRTDAQTWMDSFFGGRIELFTEGISKPLLSQKSCSRVSPYTAWGNISVRELYKQAMIYKEKGKAKKAVTVFVARLRLQSYFIQKFESQSYIEFRSADKGYMQLEQPVNKLFIDSWKEGKTGFPLVDASMRCITETGYLNFRMRSLLISFYAHHLFQHFTHISSWLAQQFLDFEPGIHYGQMQIQSGFTSNDVVRVYNPTKNAHEHDSDAAFIKKWLPELSQLPANLAIEPWLITPMEEMFYDFKLGTDYPKPIVDIEKTRIYALEALYGIRKKMKIYTKQISIDDQI